MRFLVDVQLPPALARALEAEGHQAWHLADIGLPRAEDPAIWQLAIERDAILLSKDQDFASRALRDSRGPVVVWIRIGNTSRSALLRRFMPLVPEILAQIEHGDRLIEVR